MGSTSWSRSLAGLSFWLRIRQIAWTRSPLWTNSLSREIATFADDGPKRCSGLDVRRYNAETMGAVLGDGSSLVREARETHATPWGSSQAFFHGVFRRQ